LIDWTSDISHFSNPRNITSSRVIFFVSEVVVIA
jgi:hypothetical protein